jgi:hypothetical protein
MSSRWQRDPEPGETVVPGEWLDPRGDELAGWVLRVAAMRRGIDPYASIPELRAALSRPYRGAGVAGISRESRRVAKRWPHRRFRSEGAPPPADIEIVRAGKVRAIRHAVTRELVGILSAWSADLSATASRTKSVDRMFVIAPIRGPNSVWNSGPVLTGQRCPLRD